MLLTLNRIVVDDSFLTLPTSIPELMLSSAPYLLTIIYLESHFEITSPPNCTCHISSP